MESGNYDFGMVGLGVMGSNLLLNMADHGYAVAGFDLSKEKTGAFEKSGQPGQKLLGVNSLEDLVKNLNKPRKIMMLVPAGKPVDSVISQIRPLLEPGDILIDGGNSHYTDTLARIKNLKSTGIHFMGVGISGGEEGARRGPSIMPGGDKEAWNSVAHLLKDVSAKVKGEPCVDYMGRDAAGHYVKMVHNGIEYGIMQLISEVYDLMKHGAGLNNEQIGKIFSKWNEGDMKSYLIEVTADIFKVKDRETGGYLVDSILDKAGAKGTGKWTSESGLELGIPIPNIDMAVMMRNISSLLDQRSKADTLYPVKSGRFEEGAEEIEKLLYDALYFATVITYAQGLAQITAASAELKMEVPLREVVKIWRGGCIIRSVMLDDFMKAYEKNPGLENLLLNNNNASLLQRKLPAVQKIITLAAQNNYPMAGLMAAFNYFNAYHRKLLPTNLVQAQRDYFGAHTYQRVDREGIFHTQWEEELKK